ncbi:MAG: hypothetical protein ACK5Y6_02820 [Pseudomonadota bacterium]
MHFFLYRKGYPGYDQVVVIEDNLFQRLGIPPSTFGKCCHVLAESYE